MYGKNYPTFSHNISSFHVLKTSPMDGMSYIYYVCSIIWLVVSTPSKNICQNGSFPLVRVKIKKNETTT